MQNKSSRRSFLHRASMSLASLSLVTRPLFSQSRQQEKIRVTVDPLAGGAKVPVDFVGLSYENMQLEDAGFFSPANKSLVEQFRAISLRGVLRLGGNTSEFGWWKPTAADRAPTRMDMPWKATGEPVAATLFAITPQAIDNLDGFLKATGWKCIYGLNLGYGTPETDIAEASYVFQKLGTRLEYFQVGNEVDLFKGHLRDPATWNVDAYLEQWLVIARAVQKALPGARFGLPDVAADVRWLPEVAARWSAVADKPQVVSMSHHYYWNGPPSNAAVTVANLMQSDPKVAADAALARDAAAQLGANVTIRMTEGNTVYRGGKYGVSDVFASALWSADYLLRLMSLGYAGVNLHGGSGHAQAVSVGGVFHGETLMSDPNAPHPKPFYTPIANEGTLAGSGVEGKLNGTYVLEPVAYGMKFAAAFAGATMLPVHFVSGAANATAYAGRRPDGSVILAVINKDASLRLDVDPGRCSLLSELTETALEARGAFLNSGRRLSKDGRAGVTVAPHTAVLLLLG